MKTLDRTRPFGQVIGAVDNGAAYYQDGFHFKGDGTLVDDEVAAAEQAAAEQAAAVKPKASAKAKATAVEPQVEDLA